MPTNSNPHFKTKDPDTVGLNIAALTWLVLYVLLLILFFGAHIKQPSFMKRAGHPVDVQRHLVIKTWGDYA